MSSQRNLSCGNRKKITQSNFTCVMASSFSATFVTADFLLNINNILFMLDCATVGYRFYSEYASWEEDHSVK
jgi:hypothetical protein